MRLLSDRIQEFIDWLEVETDFEHWDFDVKQMVHKKLIECMISDPHDNTDTEVGRTRITDPNDRTIG